MPLCVEPDCGRRRFPRHNFIASWEKLSTAAERSHRIRQLATGRLVSRTTSGLPAWRRQRRGSLSRRAGHETAVTELLPDYSRARPRFRCVAPYHPVPRGAPGAAQTPAGLPTDRTICAKPKGERSIWQSTKISALGNRTAKVTGRSCGSLSRSPLLGGSSLPGSYRCFGNR
jgi:hypothetical protein